jgi:hypothetical protein
MDQFLFNYMGHGSVEIWKGNFFTSSDARALTNSPRLSFFVSMTWLNGFFQDIYTESLAEALIRSQQGGAVAVWASSGISDAGEPGGHEPGALPAALQRGGADHPDKSGPEKLKDVP